MTAVEQATDTLREMGYPATPAAVQAIMDRYPWLRRKANGWQTLVTVYVNHPDFRD